MPLYGGIDLPANNRVVVLLNAQDQVLYRQRLANHLPTIVEQLAPSHAALTGVVVASTANWYGLVDGLMDADDRVHLAHPAAIEQYRGLQDTNDHSDARWLAHLLRLGVLPAGHIYPKAERAVREVLRKRAPLVRQHTSIGLSVQNILARNTGLRFGVKQIYKLSKKDRERLLPAAEQVLAVTRALAILECLRQQSTTLEQAVTKRLKPTPAYEPLWSVTGSGPILAPTIALATGHLSRCPTVGHSASYCRWVRSTKISNGKRTGQGNGKNGHPDLEWASMEAAQCAIRCSPTVQRFYQRQAAKSPRMMARKSVAHKLARACFYIRRDLVPCDVHTAFGGG